MDCDFCEKNYEYIKQNLLEEVSNLNACNECYEKWVKFMVKESDENEKI